MNNLSQRFREIHNAELSKLKYEIWAYFNRLRGTLEIEDFKFIFLILELKRKGLLENIDLSNQWNVKSIIVKNIQECKEEPYSWVINEIYQIYSREIFDVNDIAFTEFLQIINQTTNIEFFQSVYPELFEYFLEKFFDLLDKKSFGSSQPVVLTQFCFDIIKLPVNAKIYNPFAGLASFGVYAPKKSEYKGQEFSKQTWALGILRLMAHNNFESFEFTNANSISDWAPYFYSTSKSSIERLTAYDKFERKHFDLVISNPPFGLKLPNEYVNEFGYNRTAESYFIDRGMDLLKEDGKLLAFVSDNFTFASGREKQLRTKIIERDLLETIIHFPSGILKNASIPFSILILNKDKKLKQKVKLIDASKYLNGKRKRDLVIDYELLTKEVGKDYDTISQRIVSNAEILENHSKFTVDRYFIDKNFKEIENAIALNELLEHYKGEKEIEKDLGIVVKVSDLSSKQNVEPLDISKIENDIIKSEHRAIKESCLLIACKGNLLKPTFFKFENQPIYIGTNILALKVDVRKIDIRYLLNELQSDYCLDQLKKLREGSALPNLRLNDFLSVVIELPKLEVQISRFNRAAESLNQINEKIQGLEQEIISQNSYLRHKIAGSFNNIEGYMGNIIQIFNNAIKTQYPEIESLKVSPNHLFSLGDYLNKMNHDIIKMKETVSKQLRVDTDIHTKVLTPFNIISFLENYVNELIDQPNKNFEIIFEINQEAFLDEEDRFQTPLVMANMELLKNLFDNLVDNAVKHAFTDGTKNKIEIWVSREIRPEKTEFTVLFSNNGKTLPENFSFEIFITKGLISGSNGGDGFGGWYINEIMDKMEGSFDVIDERVGDFGIALKELSTSFQLFFPIIDTLENE